MVQKPLLFPCLVLLMIEIMEKQLECDFSKLLIYTVRNHISPPYSQLTLLQCLSLSLPEKNDWLKKKWNKPTFFRSSFCPKHFLSLHCCTSSSLNYAMQYAAYMTVFEVHLFLALNGKGKLIYHILRIAFAHIEVVLLKSRKRISANHNIYIHTCCILFKVEQLFLDT